MLAGRSKCRSQNGDVPDHVKRDSGLAFQAPRWLLYLICATDKVVPPRSTPNTYSAELEKKKKKEKKKSCLGYKCWLQVPTATLSGTNRDAACLILGTERGRDVSCCLGRVHASKACFFVLLRDGRHGKDMINFLCQLLHISS